MLLVVAASALREEPGNLEVKILTLTSSIPNAYNIQMRKGRERSSSVVAQ